MPLKLAPAHKSAIILLTCVTLTGLVSACRWNSDFRVNQTPQEHAKMLDIREHIESKKEDMQDNQEIGSIKGSQNEQIDVIEKMDNQTNASVQSKKASKKPSKASKNSN